MPRMTIAQTNAAFLAGKTNMMNPYSQDHATRDIFRVNYLKKMHNDFMLFAQYSPFPARGLDHVVPTIEMLHEHRETLARVLEREGIVKLIDMLDEDSIFREDALGLSFERFLTKCMTEMKLTRFQMHCIIIYRESLDHSSITADKQAESEQDILKRKQLRALESQKAAIQRRLDPALQQLRKYQRLVTELQLELHSVDEQIESTSNA